MMNHYIIKEHRKKNPKNVERLMLAGYPFKQACDICGYSEEEGNKLYTKLSYIDREKIIENKEKDDLSLEVYVGEDGRIGQKPFNFNDYLKKNL